MMQGRSVLDIPIFHKVYDLYKLLHSYQNRVPKAECYTIFQKCENTTLALLEALTGAGHQKGIERMDSLYSISNKLDLLKVLIPDDDSRNWKNDQRLD